jgi:hypothetical protein
MIRDRSPGIMAAVEVAPRAKLVRFVRFMDPGQPSWKGDPAGWTDATLRAAAFCIASHFWTARRARRDARAFARLPHGIPAGHTAVPSYRGPALDAWLRGVTPIVAEVRDVPALQTAAE